MRVLASALCPGDENRQNNPSQAQLLEERWGRGRERGEGGGGGGGGVASYIKWTGVLIEPFRGLRSGFSIS